LKIAVFGDIHANIEALDAAYSAVQLLKPDNVYHLGDLCGYSR
jgi:predicted phosphodiesterase